MSETYYIDDELYHYGIKGMKWGVRRRNDVNVSSTRANYDKAKNKYKQSKRDFSKAFDSAYNKSIAAYSPLKKHREANTKRWENAYDKAVKLNNSKNAYKQAKNIRKEKIKSTYKEINKNASLKDKLIYNNATRKKAAQYVVDNDMSVKDAMSKANKVAMRNTAMFVAAYGAASIYKLTK